MNNKKLYQQKKQAQLDEWMAKVAIFKARASGASADAQLEMHKLIAALEDRITENRTKLSELSQAGENAWETLKTGVESACSGLKSSVNAAAAKFN